MVRGSLARNLTTTISVIIPTCNRQKLFPRIHRLWKDAGVSIVIVDGSISPSRYFDELDLGTYQYLHLPFTGPFERIFTGLLFASTQYSVICGDDEYILSSTLMEAAQRLNNSSSIRFIQARFIGFEWKNQCGLRYRKIYTEQVSEWEEPEDINMRIASNALRMSPTHIYALTHRKIHLEMFRAASNVGNIPIRGLQETISEIVGSHYGQYMVTRNYGYLRSFEDSSIHALGGAVKGPINLTHADNSGTNYLPINTKYLRSLAKSIALMEGKSVREVTKTRQSLEKSLLVGFTAMAYGWKLFNTYASDSDLKRRIVEFSREPFAVKLRVDTQSLYNWYKSREEALDAGSFNINPQVELNIEEFCGFESCISDYYLNTYRGI